MDDGGFPPNSSASTNIDNYIMDQLFDAGCWVQTTQGSKFLQLGSSAPSSSGAINFPPYNFSFQGNNNSTNLTPVSQHHTYQQESERWKLTHQKAIQSVQSQAQPQNLSREGSALNSIWIAPKANSDTSTSVKDRLMQAIHNFLSLTGDRSILIQLWVPVRRGVKNYLTTVEQPYLYDPTSVSLANYRNVSETYQFLADEDSKEGLGLPGRVFLGKEPEWTPDVRFFRQEEYPRVAHAQMCDVRGSIALPVFEKESGNCLGVVEIVTTTQKITYRPEVESVCKALEAVDLRSSEILSPSKERGGNEPHSVEQSELLHILKTICDKHDLPLGQVWAPCTQASKCRHWNSEKNMQCVSTVDVACYVPEPRVSDFHQACSEQQLLRGQGVVGKAFDTHEPCYAIDVTAYSKAEYPLSHHAKMFGLRGAVAIHLQYLYSTSSTGYVLEFFLPIGCQDPDLTSHCKIMESLAMMVHGSRSFRFFSSKKVEQVTTFSGKEFLFSSNWKPSREDDPPRLESSLSEKSMHKETSWISELADAQRKGKEVAISFEKVTREEFNAESQAGQMFSDCVNNTQEFCTLSTSVYPLATRKVGEKKRTKTQKTISLDVLKEHFAGSLKDAAKSMGVCPTTLKRICRQHGITRWPSRKIKKVGHSLRKLQLVMDSVEGAQGSIQISSFYSNFPQLNSPTETNIHNQSKKVIPESIIFNSGGTTSQSTSSGHTSSSSHSLSTGAKSSPITINAGGSGDTSTSQNLTGSLKTTGSEPELHIPNNKSPTALERSQSNKSLGEHPHGEKIPPLPSNRNRAQKDKTVCKVKATFGEELIRFTLTSNMSLEDLRNEIAKRLRIDVNEMQIKYLDDDKEWVLLACADDLEECIDIHKTYGRQTVKLSVHQVTTRLGGSVGSRARS